MSKTCAFLGNDYDFKSGRKRIHYPRTDLKEKIKIQIINLIENENVDTFLVGEIGGYEEDAYDTVLELQKEYPHIRILLVISKITDLHEIGVCDEAYIMKKRGFDDFVLPPKCERGYKKLNIVYRNRYIMENSDFIIAYNEYKGRAYKYCKQAENKGVTVIELAEKNNPLISSQ